MNFQKGWVPRVESEGLGALETERDPGHVSSAYEASQQRVCGLIVALQRWLPRMHFGGPTLATVHMQEGLTRAAFLSLSLRLSIGKTIECTIQSEACHCGQTHPRNAHIISTIRSSSLLAFLSSVTLFFPIHTYPTSGISSFKKPVG